MNKSTDQIDRSGIHAVGAIFTKLGWAFREQPTSDFGIDAQAEKLNSQGMAGGKLIGLQIKTGELYFRKRGADYVFYGEDRHREYWINHSLPVFLILHNPQTGQTLWQRVERHLIEDGTDGRWSIGISDLIEKAFNRNRRRPCRKNTAVHKDEELAVCGPWAQVILPNMMMSAFNIHGQLAQPRDVMHGAPPRETTARPQTRPCPTHTG